MKTFYLLFGVFCSTLLTNAQTVVISAERKSITISNQDIEHAITASLFYKNKLIASQTLNPKNTNTNFDTHNFKIKKTISSFRQSKNYKVKIEYDQQAFLYDKTIRNARLKYEYEMFSHGAVDGCKEKIKLIILVRSIFVAAFGDLAVKLMAISDATKIDLENPGSINRLNDDIKYLESQESLFMKKLELIVNQFENSSEFNPFKECPTLEKDIQRHFTKYQKILKDKSLEDYYANKKTIGLIKHLNVNQELTKINKKILKADQPVFFLDASGYVAGTFGKEIKFGVSPFKTSYNKKGNTGRLYITFTSGDNSLSYTPSSYYQLNNPKFGINNVVVPPSENGNPSSLAFNADYVQTGLKAVKAGNLISLGIEAGVSFVHNSSSLIKASSLFELDASNILIPLSEGKITSYNNNPKIDFQTVSANLKPYINLELKANMSRLTNKNKMHSERGSLYCGAFLTGRFSKSQLLNDSEINVLTYNKKLISSKKIDANTGAYGIGVNVSYNF